MKPPQPVGRMLEALRRTRMPGAADDVSWCYRHILRREPESSEIVDAHRSWRLRTLVPEFMASPEFAHVAAARTVQHLLPAATYMSLGTHCFASSFLRRLGLRQWSGPFDWAFSSLPMVTHCLSENFASFLNPREYEPVPVDQRPNGPTVNRVQHRLYRDQFGVQFVFNHHDVHLPDGYAYLRRCVDRFSSTLRSGEPKVFLAVSHAGAGALQHAMHLRDVLRGKTTNFKLVTFLIQPDEAHPLPAAVRELDETDAAVWSFKPTSRWGAVAFENTVDEACIASLLAASAGA